jgi:aminomethyltransferase
MSGDVVTNSQPLMRTPLHGLHEDLGARMVPFSGYDMPLQYPLGVLKEHLHTRAAAGLFDVSHMGQIILRAHSGNVLDAARALERLIPAEILDLAPGRQRYAFLTSRSGGIIDDLMVANLGSHLLLIVNAARKPTDAEHLRSYLAETCDIISLEDRALMALQGPKAEAALMRLAPECAKMRFMEVRGLAIMGTECVVSRSGYTSEDGFEISTPADVAREIAEGLLEDDAVALVGLGARDSLRLEAGLCLYGSDIDETTTPAEAALAWAIPKVRRRHGSRDGGFPGAPVILRQLENGAVRRRVGLRPEGRAPVRAGARLFAAEASDEAIGGVTSGGYGPSVEAPVSMGYVTVALASPETQIFAEVRGKRLPITVSTLPFIDTHYKRG